MEYIWQDLDENNIKNQLKQREVQETHSLTKEIQELNAQLQRNRSLLAAKVEEIHDVTTQLTAAKHTNQKLIEWNKKITNENMLQLNVSENKLKSMNAELETLRADINTKATERDAIQKEHLTTIQNLRKIELLAKERKSNECEFIEKLQLLEKQLAKTSLEFHNLEQLQKQEKLTNKKLNARMIIMHSKLQERDQMLNDTRLDLESKLAKCKIGLKTIYNDDIVKLKTKHEQDVFALKSESEALKLQWLQEKKQMLSQLRTQNDQFKKTCMGLELKMQNMKTQMRTQHTDEIIKMKAKQEHESAVLKTTCKSALVENNKYVEHTQKLTAQVCRLNGNIFELKKENAFLKTKIQHFKVKPHQVNQLPNSYSSRQMLRSTNNSILPTESNCAQEQRNSYSRLTRKKTSG